MPVRVHGDSKHALSQSITQRGKSIGAYLYPRAIHGNAHFARFARAAAWHNDCCVGSGGSAVVGGSTALTYCCYVEANALLLVAD